MPAYVIFPDRTIDEILERRPASVAELAGIHGLGPSRLGRFGGELSAAIEEALRLDTTPGEDGPQPAAWYREPGRGRRDGGAEAAGDGALYGALAAWRRDRSRSEAVPPFHVFGNRVLAAIADARPRSRDELAEIAGVGPRKLERYADEVLEVVASTA